MEKKMKKRKRRSRRPDADEPVVRVTINSWTSVGSIGARHWYWAAELKLRGGGKDWDHIGPECYSEAEARRECLRALRKHLPGFRIKLNYEGHPDVRPPSEKWARDYNDSVTP